MRSYFDLIRQYGNSDLLPMHMPGHKRKAGFLGGFGRCDVTETVGTEDLHHPGAFLREAMAEAAALRGSDETYFLVNGSTAGILSAVTAAADPGDSLLLARNCHKSALNAVTVHRLNPVWIVPGKISPLRVDGGVDPADVEAALTKDASIKAALIVSPTYEGVVSDVAAIAEIVHRHNIPLIVDAAHGAHFPFSDGFPADPLRCGADIVIESLHKTLPSLTQTAALHLRGSMIPRDRLRFALQAFQSSSPSHLLLASAVECFRIMENDGARQTERFLRSLTELRNAVKGLGECVLLDKDSAAMTAYDTSKIVLGFRGYSGSALHQALRRDFRVEIEMSAPGYIVAMTTLYDSDEDLFRFGSALKKLRRALPFRGERAFPAVTAELPEKVMLPAEALIRKKETVPLKEAEGRIAGETIYLYPPGSPLAAAGERIGPELISVIRRCEERGFTVRGAEKGRLSVLRDERA
ncbi:MAG: aminotransferase class I/II-fold pyridoxal phosphate-dependent enzyme [Bacillota bacterium]|jgi:arginine decarboxylase